MRQLAKQLEEIFVADITGCEVMTLEKWRKRPLLHKIVQNAVVAAAGTGVNAGIRGQGLGSERGNRSLIPAPYAPS